MCLKGTLLPLATSDEEHLPIVVQVGIYLYLPMQRDIRRLSLKLLLFLSLTSNSRHLPNCFSSYSIARRLRALTFLCRVAVYGARHRTLALKVLKSYLPLSNMYGYRERRSSPPASVVFPENEQAAAQTIPIAPVDVPQRSPGPLGGFFHKLLPGNRPERGGTQRTHGFWEPQSDPRSHLTPLSREDPSHPRPGSDSIPPSSWNLPISLSKNANKILGAGEHHHRQHVFTRPALDVLRRRIYDPVLGQPSDSVKINSDNFDTFNIRRKTHRLRRDLKKSGDFLGVQGINPRTGELDVLTPTSSSRSGSSSQGLKAAVTSAYTAHEETQDFKPRRMELQKERVKWDRDEFRKDTIRAFQRRVRWRRHNNEWSSAAEPELSPVESMGSEEFG